MIRNVSPGGEGLRRGKEKKLHEKKFVDRGRRGGVGRKTRFRV